MFNFSDYRDKLGGRADTFEAAFKLLCKLPIPTIVETGCIRQLDNWAGDGQSTVMFNAFNNTAGGQFWTCDKSPEAVAVAKTIMTDPTYAVCGDSVPFLADFSQPIDFLYLDSFDFDQSNPHPSQLHCLYELCAAVRWMDSKSVIMIDDTWRYGTHVMGKGGLAVPFLERIRAMRVASGYQEVWALR